jgi:hypothetical protein
MTVKGKVKYIALKTGLIFDLKICLDIKPTIKTNNRCFVKGYQFQALFRSRGIKLEIILSIVIWKKKSVKKAALRRTKPKTGTAKKDKIFLRRLILRDIFFLLT